MKARFKLRLTNKDSSHNFHYHFIMLPHGIPSTIRSNPLTKHKSVHSSGKRSTRHPQQRSPVTSFSISPNILPFNFHLQTQAAILPRTYRRQMLARFVRCRAQTNRDLTKRAECVARAGVHDEFQLLVRALSIPGLLGKVPVLAAGNAKMYKYLRSISLLSFLRLVSSFAIPSFASPPFNPSQRPSSFLFMTLAARYEKFDDDRTHWASSLPFLIRFNAWRRSHTERFFVQQNVLSDRV